MKGGSAANQTRGLMQLLGGITFVVAIIYGLYLSTRDPVVWGNVEWLGTVRVVLLFLAAIIFYLIAASIGPGGKGGKGGKGKDDCFPRGGASHCDRPCDRPPKRDPPKRDRDHDRRGGYSFGSGANVASVGNDDLTDTS